MLSKFYHDGSKDTGEADTFEVSALNAAISEIYPGEDVSVEKIFPGGTLNIFYRAVIGRKNFFIKTHNNGQMNRLNLQKEIEIMKTLYKDILCIHTFSIACGNSSKEFIMMDFIDSGNAVYELQFVHNLIKTYNFQLEKVSLNKINYNVDDLYQAAVKSYDVLEKAHLLSAGVRLRCGKALKRLKEYNNCERVLCHGDLSNVNIMLWKDHVIALDWEDAVLAYPEYDILYWLTFYAQRKYYSSYLFDDIGVSEQYGKDIMLMILLIKSYISYRNKSYLNNRLSINDRLEEIIYM